MENVEKELYFMEEGLPVPVYYYDVHNGCLSKNLNLVFTK